MPLLDFQTALGRLVRTPNREDALWSLALSEVERRCLATVRQSEGFRFTVGVQQSWCRGRSEKAGSLTLSILPDEVQKRILDEWTALGGGTSSFFAAEADGFLQFIAEQLDEPSHALSICRLEQATVRANAGSADFRPPDVLLPNATQGMLCRGVHAGIARFYGDPASIVNALLQHVAPPDVCKKSETVLLFGPGVNGACRQGSIGETALWEMLSTPHPLSALLDGGHGKYEVAGMLEEGILQWQDRERLRVSEW